VPDLWTEIFLTKRFVNSSLEEQTIYWMYVLCNGQENGTLVQDLDFLQIFIHTEDGY
jgi:hypothetical protein